jgi:hypothetical protein
MRARICVDRPIHLDHKIEMAEIAISENPLNTPKPGIHMAGASFHPLKMALVTGKKWVTNRTLNIAFLDGSKIQKDKVKFHANQWLKYANLKFDFNDRADAEIRISFIADDGSWSAIGTDSLHRPSFPLGEPTMNYGWLRDDTDDIEYRRVVLHEFGHALGAIHEHQNPDGGPEWNVPEVIAQFSGPPNNWSRKDIDFNILQKYSASQLNGTKFDPKSIMLYEFPPELLKNHVGTRNNTTLSAADKRFIKKMYPK